MLIAQTYPTLRDPVDCSLTGSSFHGIFWARILEWVAISFSKGLSQPGIEPWSPALLEDSLLFEPKPPISLLGIFRREKETCVLKKHLETDICSNFIHNSKTRSNPNICQQLNNPNIRQIVVYSYNTIKLGFPGNWAYLVAQTVKNLPAVQETQIQSTGQEDPLEKGIASHSSILTWRIPWTKEPGGLQSKGLQSWTRLSN